MSAALNFAAVPVRALKDPRLQGLHLRLLGNVAWHDRFGKNGIGCVASPNTHARELGINRTNISHGLAELVTWGYLSAVRLPYDRRKLSYSVIYEEISCPQATDLEQASVAATSQGYDIKPGSVAHRQPISMLIGCPDFDEVEQNQEHARGNIFPERVDIIDSSLKSEASALPPRAREQPQPAVQAETKGQAEQERPRQRHLLLPIDGGQNASAPPEQRQGERDIPIDFDQEIVERLGGNGSGWSVLVALDNATMSHLRRCARDGTLTDDELAKASAKVDDRPHRSGRAAA